MKTTIEISDHILARAKALARKRHTTLRGLTEKGLLLVLDELAAEGPATIEPVTFAGEGLSPEFRGAAWQALRDAAYEGRGS